MPLRRGAELPSLAGATEWVNGETTRESLIGSPCLVHFWSLSCYICKNNLPALAEWKAKYGPQGLKVVAIHMPRSEDETNVELVKQSMLEHGIKESCAIDIMHDVKDAFLNEAGFVPHYYVFNADGILESRAAGDAGVASIDAALVKLFTA